MGFLSYSLFANAWFSISILRVSLFLTAIFRLDGDGLKEDNEIVFKLPTEL